MSLEISIFFFRQTIQSDTFSWNFCHINEVMDQKACAWVKACFNVFGVYTTMRVN